MVEIGPLGSGQRASCPRCDHLLTAFDGEATTRGLAFALAAAILLVVANSFPFLELHSGGIEKVMTIPETTRKAPKRNNPNCRRTDFPPTT